MAGSSSARAPLRLATRGSPQARTQTQIVADAITAATGRATELVLVETSGDRKQAVPLHTIGGQGVFVKEVQQAVLDGRADAAVHSAKDLPSETPPGLRLAAFCARRDAADALVGRSLGGLGDGAVVATGSVRRRAQLAGVRPDLCFVDLRGNIARRLDKVPDGGAIVMAVAALDVLGMTERIAERLDPTEFVPAVGQGCVAVECRADDRATAEAVAAVDDAGTRFAVSTERSFLAELGAGCTLPLGAYCWAGRLYTFLAATAAPGPGDFWAPPRPGDFWAPPRPGDFWAPPRPGTLAFRDVIDVPAEAAAASVAAAAVARRARAAVAA